MQKLIEILLRFHHFWLFIVLQGVCFYLIIQNHTHHRAVFNENVYQVAGVLFQQRDATIEYFRLREVNDSLLAENARLRDRMPDVLYRNMHRVGEVHDTLFRQQYKYIPARVVNNSVDQPSNYLTLNRGSRHDVSAPMGVISPQGLVGVVTHVSQHYAAAMSVLHQDFRVSAEIRESGVTGTLVWEGEQEDKLVLLHIPRHETIEIGQNVVTSPFSRIYPRGIPIGTVMDYEMDPILNSYRVYVRPAVNYRNLRFAYIINNLMYQEQTTLEEKAQQ